MSHVVTLIAAVGSATPLAQIAENLCAKLVNSQSVVWLAEEACDIPFRPESQAALAHAREAVDDLRRAAALDAFIQPVAGRRKRLLVADMDSTIIREECLDEIAAVAGIGPEIAAITERTMRGELNFESSLRERIGLLRGFPESRLWEVLERRITLTPGAQVLTGTMRANGGRAVLVSGGFAYFTAAVAARAGFDAHYGSRFVIENGVIAGVADPILGQNAKLTTLESEAAAFGIGHDDVIAVGDGANDLAMLKAAGLGVAFRGKPVVVAQAAARIDHGDLAALLYLQGYRRDEFVNAAAL